MRVTRSILMLLALAVVASAAEAPRAAASGRVKSLKVTVLSTMLADIAAGESTVGEWGFAALVEADGHRILFDTGANRDVVRRNAEILKIDLTTVTDVILSHSHWDHVGGFMALRDAVKERAPKALARTHVAEGIFTPRVIASTGVATNPVLMFKADYEAGGGAFVVHPKAVQIFPGVWLTGPVPRPHAERNWPSSVQLVTANGRVEDNVPEDMSLICDTDAGLVVITGCGHAGAINIVDHARASVRPARIHALIGGVHLFNASEEVLSWTSHRLRNIGVDHLLGAHCTGVETLYRLRRDLGLDRARAVVAAVGSRFELDRGIAPGVIAQ